MAEERPRSSLHLRLFGPFDVRVDDCLIPPLRSRKHLCLLALLVLRFGREVQRDWLAGTLWPESDQKAAFNSLRQALLDVRRALGSQAARLHSPTRATLRFDLTDAVVDLAAFHAAIKRGTPSELEEAVALYRGPLLEGWTDEWMSLERLHLEQCYIDALEKLADAIPDNAQDFLKRIILVDPYRESAYCRLMQAQAEAGDYASVTQVYRELRLLLLRELNQEQSAETKALFHRLRDAGRTALLPPRFVPPFPLSTARELHNLPRQITPFIGRETEIKAVSSRLDQVRLLTLTGCGGCGKTRLSLQVAEAVIGHYPDGVWFVELAALTDDSLVPSAVAKVLAIAEMPGEPVAGALVTAIRDCQMLLILDNCEHVLDETARLAEAILQACPMVKILVGSRECLGIIGENAFRVPSLSFPQPTETSTPESLRRYEATRLFMNRAVAARADFTVTSANASAVASICHRLDGIPFAIELAAVCIRGLPVEEIDTRLDDCFSLLTRGSRTALPRQQTLRAMLDWSYNLLDEKQKLLLCRLSVFIGGWQMEAAEAVCPGGIVEVGEIFDFLQSLVEKSMVVCEERAGAARYRLLETVRQYAREKLKNMGESDGVQERHWDYFLALAEAEGPKYAGADQAESMQRLDADYENLRAALEWSLQKARSDVSRLCSALAAFWWTRGHLSEGRKWCERALEPLCSEERADKRADLLNGAGLLAMFQGDYDASQTYLKESMEILQAIEDRRGVGYALCNLGQVAHYKGDYNRALTCNVESLGIFRKIDDRRGIGTALSNLGNIAQIQGDYVDALAWNYDSLSIFKQLGDQRNIAYVLSNLGDVAASQGEADRARNFFEASLNIRREIGDRRGAAYTLTGLGNVACDQGDIVQARRYYTESLHIRRETGSGNGIAYSLLGMGNVAALQGDDSQAQYYYGEGLNLCRKIGDKRGIAIAMEAYARLAVKEFDPKQAVAFWRAAEDLRVEIGAPLPPNARESHARDRHKILQALGETAFANEWSQNGLLIEQAVVYALLSE